MARAIGIGYQDFEMARRENYFAALSLKMLSEYLSRYYEKKVLIGGTR